MAKRPVPLYDFAAFGQAIKAARTGRNESRKKVSDEMNISPRYLANIENKGQQPSLQIFYELVTRYDISVDQFFFPDKTAEKSTQRRQLDTLLDSMSDTDRVLSLSVVRVYCKTCGHTHALLLSSMVPYSQIPLVLHVRLIHAYEHETGFRNILAEQYLVDENNLKSIIRNYRLHWKQRLLSMRLHLPDIPSLISGCFSLFSRQFMQIKSTSNKLFILPT